MHVIAYIDEIAGEVEPYKEVCDRTQDAGRSRCKKTTLRSCMYKSNWTEFFPINCFRPNLEIHKFDIRNKCPIIQNLLFQSSARELSINPHRWRSGFTIFTFSQIHGIEKVMWLMKKSISSFLRLYIRLEGSWIYKNDFGNYICLSSLVSVMPKLVNRFGMVAYFGHITRLHSAKIAPTILIKFYLNVPSMCPNKMY